MRVQRTGFGKRILDSFVLLIIGIVMFLGSFIVLFLNEGRENYAEVAKEATLYDAAVTYQDNELVYTVGALSSTNPVTDDYLSRTDIIRLIRHVEMYAYVEIEHSETEEHVGGSQTTTYTYTYELQWVNDPRPTTTYRGDASEVPSNMPNAYNQWISEKPQERNVTASGLSIEGVNVNENHLSISGLKPLNLTSDDIDANALLANESLQNSRLFRQNSDTGTLTNPEVGDVRIFYEVVTDQDNGLLFATVTNQAFSRHITPNNNTFYRFFSGVVVFSEAISILQSEYQTALWLFRIIGFAMMFMGLLFMAKPAQTLLSVVPIFARIGMFLYGIVAFIIALLLSSVVIILSIIFHNVYLAIGVVALIIMIAMVMLKRKQTARLNTPT